ncbi:imelysin family protein [Marinobacterium weihaiense]|uniref:Imelysin family protein n=1 Tax=Marinobacterium weihaiense TaxID=2851016 RepID=A0ABS6MBY7_9GAMM|nr:imelysin family protein [Marinobacterium weihaiense]MBV0933760.1 imelysin family protein [Marinobacterium weihaiense]
MHTPAKRIWPLWLATTGLVLAAGLAHADTSIPDWPRFNQQAVQQHVLPRYAALEHSTATLERTTSAFCTTPSAAALEQARADWHNAMQAWQGIQHVQFGPVQFLMRNFGLEFWPDRKNIGARQLRQALASDQPYDAKFFRQASVSIQGFPALERLLFADNALEQLQQGRKCELSQAISGHVAAVSRAIHQEWQTQAEADFTASQEDEVAAELAVELMASLVEPIEAIRDSKLLKPMGKSAEAARYKRLESHRSSSSLANIRSNLAALQELYQGNQPSVDSLLREAGAAALADEISATFNQLQQQLKQVSTPLKIAITQPEQHARLTEVTAQLKQLSEQLDNAMDVLGIQLGFNSRDGD